MSKYIVQQNKYDCVAVAIFNMFRFYNRETPFKKLSKIRRRLLTNKNGPGTFHSDIIHAVKNMFIITGYYQRNSLFSPLGVELIPTEKSLLLSHLEKKPAFIGLFDKKHGINHMIFVEGYSPRNNKITCNAFGRKRTKLYLNGTANLSYYFLIEGVKNGTQ